MTIVAKASAVPQLALSTRRYIVTYMTITGIVVLLMMILGLAMRLSQSDWIAIDPALFYQIMTVHGVGMVGIAAFGGVGVMWYFLSRHIALSAVILGVNLVIFLIGVVAILVADLLDGFAGAWTFLYPLPAMSGEAWPRSAAALHLGGLLAIGVGFLLVCLEIGRGLISAYGGIGRALGWPKLFLNHDDDVPPPTVVAGTMVVIVTTLALIAGATILTMSLINLYSPDIAVDPLLAKNLTYFFGHVFINATIYMAVTAVYELLPRITGRPWKTSRVFLAAWTLSTTMVLIIYPHHLLMDFVMPYWAMVIGQVLSYVNSFPVLLVTGIGALTILYRAGIRWELISTLLLVAMFGWMAGVVPAVIDATISVNSVMHNTMWVPGHFHFYLLLGLLPMIFAFMTYLARGERVEAPAAGGLGDWTAALYLLAGLGFVTMFLVGGWASVPRRWAVHLPEWQIWDRLASMFAVVVVLVTALFVLSFVTRLPRMLRRP